MNNLLNKLETVGKLAKASRINRLWAHPVKYILAILHRKIVYAALARTWKVDAPTFFGKKMKVLLPGGTDIYLTGGKTHLSEIQLARFLIQNLKEGDQFLDIGAHYGFFSLLAAELVGRKGKVWSIEPSERSFCILSENTQAFEQIHCFRKAVSDQSGVIEFHEFPELYSEYNSIHQQQFKDEKWFSHFRPLKVKVESITLDEFLTREKADPGMVKIDVEGAEYEVLLGSQTFLRSNAPTIIMEYLSPEKDNRPHKRAVQLATSLGFRLFFLDQRGEKNEVPSSNLLDQKLSEAGLDSTNIILSKTKI